LPAVSSRSLHVAKNAVAGELRGTVARAVACELAARAVRLPAVEFDDDALVAPQRIDFDRHLA
jgi:hypothetical protein